MAWKWYENGNRIETELKQNGNEMEMEWEWKKNIKGNRNGMEME